MKRIRYSKNSSGNLISVKKLYHPTNGARYEVQLDLVERQWLILDDASGMVAASGHNNSLAMMKIEVKRALAVLGIEFENETRGTHGKDA